MTKSEFKSFIKSVPKAELHIHIEAVITLAGIRKMYKNRFGKEMTKEEQTALFSYNDLNGFIQAFLKVQDLFVSEKDFNVVFKELEKYLVRNGIDYCEAFFAPTAFLKKGFSYEKMVEIFHKQIKRIKEKDGITIKLLMDVSRTFGCENAMKNYELLKQYPCEDIIGIGLGGAEAKGPAKEYAPVFQLAKKEGWRVVAHAGEDVGPESHTDSTYRGISVRCTCSWWRSPRDRRIRPRSGYSSDLRRRVCRCGTEPLGYRCDSGPIRRR